MRSMLILGGSGGMPPQEILKNRCSEMAFLSASLLARALRTFNSRVK